MSKMGSELTSVIGTNTPSAARGRSYAAKRGGTGLVARLRSRSASISRGNRGRSRSHHGHEQNDDEVALPPDEPSSRGQMEDLLERHQLALKMDVMDILESRDKEIMFWKNKALKLRKKLSALEKEDGGEGGVAASSAGHESLHASSKGCDDGSDADHQQQQLLGRVAFLEQAVQDRDTQLGSLRGAMETQEKTSGERVRLLENQLERLVEMQTKVKVGKMGSSMASTLLMSSDNDLSGVSDTENSKAGMGIDIGIGGASYYDDPTHEITALEQLLARVLAEKDKLSFENDNLRVVVKETVSASHAMNVENMNKTTTTPPPGEIMYQLSCRKCDGQHYINSTSKDLKKMARQHFSAVWKVVQEQADGDEKDPVLTTSSSNDFISSHLAHHLANHCKDMESEEAVRKWCKKNVKLEKVTGGSPAPSTNPGDINRSGRF